MIIYVIEMHNDDIGDIVMGYATSEPKAKKMIETLQNTDGFEDYEYEYYWVYIDKLVINDRHINF